MAVMETAPPAELEGQKPGGGLGGRAGWWADDGAAQEDFSILAVMELAPLIRVSFVSTCEDEEKMKR